MKIKIEFEENLQEEEIIIRCNSLTEKIQKIQKTLSEVENTKEKMILFKNETEYYLNLEDILFFETGLHGIEAHTIDNIFQCKFKLYELEEILPGSFMRISKSAILNTNKVYAINRNLTASSVIEFKNTHKQVYVSRNYYKPLKNKLEEKR
jgi:Response regulator of the LytR/AlgR family